MSDSAPEPVIQVVLLVGSAEQVASVMYSTPARPVIPADPRAVPPDSVSLVLEDPTGARTPFLPAPGEGGRFVAAMSPEPLTLYRLRGAVLGRTVAAEVYTTGPLEILEPRADTIRISRGDAMPALPFVWRAAGAVSYSAILVKSSSEQFTAALGAGRDSSMVLFPHPFFQPPETTEVRVTAIERAAAQFFGGSGDDRGERIGNIPGVFGVFGAGSRAAPKVIVWQ
jgi:hypothetical protein